MCEGGFWHPDWGGKMTDILNYLGVFMGEDSQASEVVVFLSRNNVSAFACQDDGAQVLPFVFIHFNDFNDKLHPRTHHHV